MEIHRLGGSFGAVEVNYITLTPNETFPYIPATVPRADLNDFQTVNGSVRFMAGQEVGTFNLQILDDLVPEEDEVVYVRLTGVRLVETAQIRAGMMNKNS
ncbi:hypothetical protein DPMN_060713 [Dreissena polymorpha]|uniref:Uncharacterized protein n=1 Tax=Dreissena polymorpha TaxID=45954 RepID=A0A9D4HGC2_DREPO|nr:hypothetical protein DPMN_060713 [Dreissena polymorpha]